MGEDATAGPAPPDDLFGRTPGEPVGGELTARPDYHFLSAESFGATFPEATGKSLGPVVMELTPRLPFVPRPPDIPSAESAGGGLEAQNAYAASASFDVYLWLTGEPTPFGITSRLLVDQDHLVVGATYVIEFAVSAPNVVVPTDATFRVTTRRTVRRFPIEDPHQVLAVLMQPEEDGSSIASVAAIGDIGWNFRVCRLSRVIEEPVPVR